MKKISKYRILKRILGRCQMEGCKNANEITVSIDLMGESETGKIKCVSSRKFHFCEKCGFALVCSAIGNEEVTD